MLDELHHRPEVWVWASHPQDDGVAVTKPDNSTLTTTFHSSEGLSDNLERSSSFCEMLVWRVFPPVFEMLHTAQAAEPAVDHDGHSGAECFTLLHAAQKHTPG